MFETDTATWFPPDFDLGSWFVQIYLRGEPVLVAGEPGEGGVITLQVKGEHVYLSADKARDLAKSLTLAADNATGDRGGSTGPEFDLEADDQIPF